MMRSPISLGAISVSAIVLLSACASTEDSIDVGAVDHDPDPLNTVHNCEIGPAGCLSCGELFADDTCEVADVCATSLEIYDDAHSCMCAECPDVCADRCADVDVDFTTECAGCVVDRCADEATACVNDWP